MFVPRASLLETLRQRCGSESALRRSLEDARGDLGLREEDAISPPCVAYALLKLRAQTEEVFRLLTWREFEALAGAVLRSSGYGVKVNVVLTKPRAQIDVVAYGTSHILSIDCKHHRREDGPSSLVKFAEAQLRRSSLLRRKIDGQRPIVSMILSMSEPEGRFVKGVAVVPVRTLRNFLNSLDSYTDKLELR